LLQAASQSIQPPPAKLKKTAAVDFKKFRLFMDSEMKSGKSPAWE